MKIDFIYDKGSGTLNEDNFLIQGSKFGVFDGAGSLDKFVDKNGKTGGYLAAKIVKNCFKKEGALVNLTVFANKKVREEMVSQKIDISKKINLWSTALAVVKVEDNFFEWVQIGDSLIIVIYEDSTFKILVDEYDHDKKLLKMWKKYADKKISNIKKRLNDQTIKVRKTMNISYGIINGEEKMKKFLKCGKESLSKVKHLLLFTDGLFIPKPNPQEPDNFAKFVKLYTEGGLNKIKKYVRQVEKNDPNCWVYPRFKQYDDITAISISF